MTKHPWLAALLNFIIPGAGYLYLGKRKVFGTLLVAATLLVLVPSFTAAQPEKFFSSTWEILAQLVMAAAFAFDAYKVAQASE